MKSRILFSLVLAAIPFFGFAQMDDDMYFVPKKTTKEQPKKNAVTSADKPSDTPVSSGISYVPATTADYSGGTTRDIDEYNRRDRWTEDVETEAEDDSMTAAEPIQDPEEAYQYSKRILRFNTPTIGVAVSSPLYWDLRYGPNSIYWDVYDDGFYAYAYPTTWNSLYWGPSFSVSWGWGGYNPYWGWGRPWYDPWYAGWHNPWYHGPHWHHPHWNNPHWGHPGHGAPSRPSVRYRENSTLARGNSRPSTTRIGSTTGNRVSDKTNNTVRRGTPNTSGRRPSTTSRQPSRNESATPQTRPQRQPSRGTSMTPSTSRSNSFRPSISTPGRSTGGGMPSRSGGGVSRGRR